METPIAPEVWLRLAMVGAPTTVNGEPLLADPKTVTTTFPVVAPAGTFTVALVALHAVAAAAATPLNVTVLVPWAAPKLVPVIVMGTPTAAEIWLRLVMLGGGTMVSSEPLLASVPTVTTTFPVVAPAGTATVMLLALHALAAAAVTPLNFTVLVLCVAPNPVPVIVIDALTAPDVWLKLVIAGPTVNGKPLLATADTVTTTLPVEAAAGTFTVILVALHALAAAAATPLNVTVLLPCAAPKFDPVIVIAVPATPEIWLRLMRIAGTTKFCELLATLETVTMTLPVAAPAGTVSTMLVSDQVVIDAATPPKVTALVPWVAPNPVPVIVIEAPTAPEVELRLVIIGPAGAAFEWLVHPASPVASTTTKRSIHAARTPFHLESFLPRRSLPEIFRANSLLHCGTNDSTERISLRIDVYPFVF